MRFSYFDSLSARNQAIYRKSDAVAEVPLGDPGRLAALAEAIRDALATDQVKQVQLMSARLSSELLDALGVPQVTVKVLARRPNRHGEELHGIYEREEGQRAQVTVWMRTAAKKRVVTYRTFLRTLLHEICHHLDYDLFGLADTFHTEGFFKRESSLMKALAPPPARTRAGSKPEHPPKPTKPAKPRAARHKREQLKLDF